jgi:hypothetical protein
MGEAVMTDEYSRVIEDSIPVQNYDSDRGEFNQQAKQPDRESSGFWLIGDSIVVSKSSMPTLEHAQRVFKGQTITTLDKNENGQQSESTHTPNINRLTRWGSSLYRSAP